MKLSFKIVLFTSFLLASLFSFAVISGGSAHCLASLMEGAACPEGLFGFATFHISFFKNFSSVASESLGFLILFLTVGILFSTPVKPRKDVSLKGFSFLRGESAGGPLQLIKKLRSWFSLLETSPTSIIAR